MLSQTSSAPLPHCTQNIVFLSLGHCPGSAELTCLLFWTLCPTPLTFSIPNHLPPYRHTRLLTWSLCCPFSHHFPWLTSTYPLTQAHCHIISETFPTLVPRALAELSAPRFEFSYTLASLLLAFPTYKVGMISVVSFIGKLWELMGPVDLKHLEQLALE